MPTTCTYCGINPSGKSDHVFPKSLGGQDIYMDCVCDKCNNDFSKFERELFQKSLVGLMRSSEGVEGYSKNKKRPAALKFAEIFQFDSENKIVYEIGVHNGFKHYMRPQFIQAHGKIYAEGPTQEEFDSFIKAFNIWRNDNLIMVTKFPANKGEQYEAVKFVLNDGIYVTEKVELPKVKKEIIHYNLMKNDDEIKKHFEPRIYFDDSNKLIVRSREVNEGIEFLNNLLNYCNEAGQFKSYSEKQLTDPIQVSMSFDIVMMQQALVKIGLNSLMHYYPETKYNPLLNPAKKYAQDGESIRAALDKKIEILDSRLDMHSILFYQLDEGLMIRTALFGGNFTYTFLIENLNLFNESGNFSGLEVDFKLCKQNHYSMTDYLINRINDLSQIKRKE